MLRHALGAVPIESPWYAVMTRYANHVAARVRGFGGNPDCVPASPDGGEGKEAWEANHSLLGRLCGFVERIIARCRTCPLCGCSRKHCRCRRH